MPCNELCFAVQKAMQTPTGRMPTQRDAAFKWFQAQANKTIQNAALKTINTDNPVTVRAATKSQAIEIAFNYVWEN